MLLAGSSAGAPTGADIVVGTSSDAVNGAVGTVGELLANPGPDGISLREAIQATNNDPGAYAIRFAPALAGTTITVDSYLPPLTGGGVTVEGDIDGDGVPDVTLRPAPDFVEICCEHGGLQVASSGNRLHALNLEGFAVGIALEVVDNPSPTYGTFADNVVSELVVRGTHEGVTLRTPYISECALQRGRPPCPTYNRWTNTVITGNTIESPLAYGIYVSLNYTVGDRVEGMTITDNTIRLRSEPDPSRLAVGILLAEGGNSTQTWISDVLIARNSIDGVNGQWGIQLAAGFQRGQANTIEGVRIVDNRVHLVRQGLVPCCQGIELVAGSDVWAEQARPVDYPEGNVVRDVEIARNSVSGSLAAGVRVMAGTHGGGSHNRIENVHVERNVIRSTMKGQGVYLFVGDILPFEGTPATGNRITAVTIAANRITTGKSPPSPGEAIRGSAGGIVLLAGWFYGRDGVVRNVRITNNQMTTAAAGVRLIGGIGPTARGNRVSCVRLSGNRVTGTQVAVSVTPNLVDPRDGKPAKGNRASLGGC